MAVQRSNIAQFDIGEPDYQHVQETHYEYDPFGNLVKTTFADETFVTAEYDAFGRKTAETNQLGLTRTFEYDESGRLTAVELPAVPDPHNNGDPTRPRYEYAYDAFGNQTLVRDPLGHETRWAFDARGRELSRTLPLGFGPDGIQGTADDEDLLATEGDFTERFEYDARGRQVLHVSFEGVVTQLVYDPQTGRLAERRFFENLDQYNDGQGTPTETIEYIYDAFGRPAEVTHTRGAAVSVTQTSYDPRGRVLRIVTDQGAVNYEYDPITNLRTRTFTGETGSYAGDQADPVSDFHYEYDVFGRLTKVTVHERNDQPLAEPDREVTEYVYDLLGRLDRQIAANGIITDYLYDDLNRLDVLTHYLPDETPEDLSDNPVLAEFDYTLRADGKRIAATETFWFDANGNGTADPHVNEITWTYDDAGRLIDEVFDHYDDLLDQTQSFTYDLAGNRLEKSVDLGNNGVIDQVFKSFYDANDRLLMEEADLNNNGTVDRTTQYEYDVTQQIGKTVTDETTQQLTESTTFSYDLQGRLAQAVIETFDGQGNVSRRESTSYTYNHTYTADGIRVSALHEVDENADGTYDSRTRIDYLIDPYNHTGYSQVLEETITDVTDEQAPQETKRIVYTIGHDHLAQTTFTPTGPTEGETVVFHHDGLGSTRVLTDVNAEIAVVGESPNEIPQIYHFDAYGNALGFEPAAALTAYLYRGEQFDTRIGQQYLKARYYDAGSGLFNRLDPFFGNLHDPQSLHKYLYVHADPIQMFDPTGQFASTIGGMVGLSIGVGFLLLTNPNPLNAPGPNDDIVGGQDALVAAIPGELAGGVVFKIVGRIAIPVVKGAGSYVMTKITNQLARSRIGHVIYGKLDDLGRATGIHAYITPDMITRKSTGGPGTDAASWLRPAGFEGEAAGHARGHLLAKLLGGLGTIKENLVPLIQNPVNAPVMSGFESRIARAVEAGEIVKYTVIPRYIGSQLVPDSVRLVARGNKGFRLDDVIFNW